MTSTQQPKIATFHAPAAKWWQAVGFCFLMSLIGLRLYPLILILLMFFIWIWRKDRYYFTIEIMLLVGGFGLMPFNVLPMRIADVCVPLGLITILIYRQTPKMKIITLAMLAYFAIIVLIASTSLESMSVQFYRMRNYLTIAVLFIPILIFANRPFEWQKFIEALTAHALVICAFYVIDGFIFGGFVLLPGCVGGGVSSSIFDLYVGQPFVRHYPPGLYLLIPIIPALNYGKLRLSWFQWALILLSLYISRTNSLLFALIACWVIFRPQVRQIAIYSVTATVLIIGGYFIDKATGGNLRLAENIDQFSALDAAQDDEDLAEFGSGRMAQILPKWELLSDMHRLHLGFGFLHPEKSTNPKFQIRNDYYTDESQSDEVATEVEVTQVQTILDIGFIGFFAQLFFYVGIYFIIRRMQYSRYYLCTLIGISVLGIGGFAGLNNIHGLTLLAFVLGAILCANKTISLNPSTQIAQ